VSALLQHAEYELGLIDNGDEMQRAINQSILDVVKAFAKAGHSGLSSNYALGVIEKLLRFEPLKPLTGADDEWEDVSDNLFQNRRCSRVFKEKATGISFDIQGLIFLDKDGISYTNRESHVTIKFPYIPVSEYVDEII